MDTEDSSIPAGKVCNVKQLCEVGF